MKNSYIFKYVLSICLLILVGLTNVKAQVATTYTWSASSNAYGVFVGTGATAVGGATILDDNSYTTTSIPFAFFYNGTTYPAGSTLGFNANGFVRIGSAPTNSYNTLTLNTNSVAAFNRDLQEQRLATTTGTWAIGSNTMTVASATGWAVGMKINGATAGLTPAGIPAGTIVTNIAGNVITMSQNATAAGTGVTVGPASSLTIWTVGTAPNRSFVFQWVNYRRFLATVGQDNYNFQVWLNEGGGVAANQTVQVRYGNCLSTSATAIAPQVGINGSAVTDFNNRTGASWSASTAGVANTATMTHSSTVFPASGLTWTWTFNPPPPPVVTSIPASGCAGVPITITGTGFTGATSVTFGGQPAAAFTVNSATNISATPGLSSSGTISVTTPFGTGTSSGSFTILAPEPTPTVTASPTSYCGSGGTATLTATGGNGTFQWTDLEGSPSLSNTTGSSITATLTQTSAISVISPGTCNSLPAIVSIGVYPLPGATVSVTPLQACAGDPITVNSGLSAGNFSSASIPHAPRTAPPTPTVLATGGAATVALTSGSLDDGGWGSRPLGFTFNFFGTNYTTCNIGTNGTIMFGTYNGSALADFTYVTLPSLTEPLGMVAVLAMDNHLTTNAGANGTVRTWTEGYAPNRRFVVEYLNVRRFGATTTSTAQAIFYETTGVVEVHVTGSTDNTANKLVGINGPLGDIGVLAFASGAATITTPFAYRFTPPANYNTTWSINGTPQTPGVNQFTLTPTPPVTTTNYSISYTNTTTGCTGTGSLSFSPVTGASLLSGTNAVNTTTPFLGQNVTFTNTGASVGFVYQWQSGSSGTGPWTNIAGATSTTYSFGASQTAFYRMVVSCASASASTATSATQINVNTSQIWMGNANITTCTSTPFYDSGGPSATYGVSEDFTITFNPSVAANNIRIAFTSYDVELGWDYIYIYNGPTTGSPLLATLNGAGGPVTYTSSDVSGALTVRFTSDGSVNNSGWNATVSCVTPCSGTPAAGTASASPASPCAGGASALSITGGSTQADITYQWQSSPDNSAWTNIAGATNQGYNASSIYNPTWYRLVSTCTNGGGNAASVSTQVTPNTSCIQMGNGSITTCSGTFYDSGGLSGNYADNEFFTFTIFPSVPGNKVQVAFTAFSTENNYDGLMIYNGNSTAEPLISSGLLAGFNATTCPAGSWRGTGSPGTVISTAADGSLTFVFRSEGSVNSTGWAATISCLTPCSGTPTAGATASTVPTACSGANFTLSLTGSTAALDLTYQWQSSPDNSAWTNISGATNNTTVQSQAASTYYRCVLTCANSGLSAASTSLQVTLNPFYNCYPAPSSLGSSCITNVSIGTLNNTTAGCSVGNYSQQPGVPVLFKGITYSASVTVDLNAIVSMWIDFNGNGTFESSEWIQPYTNATSGTVSWTMPNLPFTGQTGMRVRSRNSGNTNGATDALTAFGSGECEDYVVNIQVPPACSGTPAPGNTVSSAASVCAATNFNLSVSGNLLFTGLTFQWQGSLDNTLWSNISGATSASYVAQQSVATYYRLRVSCGASNAVSTSLLVNMNAPTACYCTPTYLNAPSGDFIAGVSLNGTPALNNVTGQNNTAPYFTLYTTPTTTLTPGSSYSITLTSGTWGSDNYLAAWIDFNANGVFEPLEKLGESGALGASTTYTANFTVPLYGASGLTRLRVREVYFTSGIDPCLQYGFGETEDYEITIATLPICSGTPAVANVTASVNPVVINNPFTLDITGLGANSGFTFQWQESTDNINWADIFGATSVPFVTSQNVNKYYRLSVKCTASGLSSLSNSLLVKVNNYCTPAYTFGTGGGDYISRVRIVDNTGTEVLNNGSGASASYPFYTNYTVSAANPVIYAGTFFWLRVNRGTYTGPNVVIQAWIDWNSNGLFDNATEKVRWTSSILNFFGDADNGGTNSVANLYVEVPGLSGSVTPGFKRVRVRYIDAGYEPLNAGNTMDACAEYGFGESEDYDIELVAPVCSGSSTAFEVTGVTPLLSTVNDRVTFALSGTPVGLRSFEYSASPTFATTDGSFVEWGVTAGGTGHINSSSPSFVQNINNTDLYVRGVFQQEGCAPAYTAPVLVKMNCASTIALPQPKFASGITNVTIQDGATTLLNNSSATLPNDGYTNFKSISSPNLQRGKVYNISITTFGTLSQHRRVWIDYNGNGAVEAGESVYASVNTVGSGVGTISGTFSIPCGTYEGPVTMRVQAIYDNPNGTPQFITNDPCASGFYWFGEIEEYTVDIQPLPNVAFNPVSAVCVPGGTVPVTASNGNGTYTWAPASGLSATTGSPVTVVSALNLVFYTVTSTDPVSGCTITGTLPAATLPTGGQVTPATSVVCSGQSKTFNTSGAGNFQWQSTTQDPTLFPNSWTNIPGATQNTYNATGITSDRWVRCIAKSSACFDISSTTAVVRVSATPIVTITNVTSTSAQVSWTPYASGQYNITWSGAAGTGSASGVTTNTYSISGLNPNANLNVNVILATPTCTGTNPGTATTKTLCAKPTGLNLTTITLPTTSNKLIRATWSAVAGATAYRVYYRNMNNNSSWAFVDTTGGTVKTLPVLASPNSTWAVYVAVNNCSTNPTALGEGSAISYITILPTSGCNVPTFSAISNCPNQLSITGMSGSPTGNYRVTFRRIFPSFTSSVTYAVSSPNFNISIGSQNSGSVYEVYVQSVCTGPTTSENSPVQIVEVKPACAALTNPLISNVNCFGGTISWNPTTCVGVTGYYMYIKKTTATAYSAYPTGGLNTYRVINFLTPNTAYNIYVSSVSCNGYISPASSILTFTTGGPGCREEEAETVEAVNAQGEGINIFPNPTDGNFSVSVNSNDLSAQEVRIEVMNAIGQIMVTNITNMTGGNLIEGIQLDNSVASGVYFVRVHVGKNVYVNRLVLSRD